MSRLFGKLLMGVTGYCEFYQTCAPARLSLTTLFLRLASRFLIAVIGWKRRSSTNPIMGSGRSMGQQWNPSRGWRFLSNRTDRCPLAVP